MSMSPRSVVLLCLVGASLTLALPKKINIGFENSNGKIIGGVDAEVGEFPWQVSLQYNGGAGFRHSCGGSILDATHIVCAAHCVDGRQASNMLIVAGAHNISDGQEATQQRIPLASYRIHENYDQIFISNDISVLELESPLTFNEFVQPATLCQEEPSAGIFVVNSGWGNAHPQGGTPVILPDILQKVTLESISRVTCRGSYPFSIREHMVCAVGFSENPSGACNGDSGGPLMYTPTGSEGHCLVGIVSFGQQPCGFAPSVYTSVPFFLDWIAVNSQ